MYKKTIGALLLLFLFNVKAYDKAWIEAFIFNTPPSTSAQYTYDIYIDYRLVASYPCNSWLSGYFAKGDIGKFLDEGKLKAEEECFAALLDAISLRKHQKNPFQPWGTSWWEAGEDRGKSRRAQSDKKFAKQWAKERQQKVDKRNATIQQWPSWHIDHELRVLKKELIRRIKRIENQLKHKYWFERKYLLASIVGFVATAVCACHAYSNYMVGLQQKAEYADMEAMLKKNGVQIFNKFDDLPPSVQAAERFSYWLNQLNSISWDPNVIIVRDEWWALFPADSLENKIQLDKYSKLREKKFRGYPDDKSLVWGFFAIFPLCLTAQAFSYACDPNYDNEYLPKYKNLLRFINYLERYGYGDWKFEEN